MIQISSGITSNAKDSIINKIRERTQTFREKGPVRHAFTQRRKSAEIFF